DGRFRGGRGRELIPGDVVVGKEFPHQRLDVELEAHRPHLGHEPTAMELGAVLQLYRLDASTDSSRRLEHLDSIASLREFAGAVETRNTATDDGDRAPAVHSGPHSDCVT